jgi:two-component system, NarL family, response regulator DesR
MIRVLIVDDHRIVAAGLGAVLDGLVIGGEQIVWRTISEPAKLPSVLAREEPFHVAFVDMLMPGGVSGIDVLALMRDSAPECRLIIFTGAGEVARHHIAEAWANYDVSGALSKDASEAQVHDAIRMALDGGQYVDPLIRPYLGARGKGIATELLRRDKHADVWCALARGITEPEAIARTTSRSLSSINKVWADMAQDMVRLGLVDDVPSRVQIAQYAASNSRFFLDWERRNRPIR